MSPWHAIILVWSVVAIVIGGALWHAAATYGYRGRHRLADRLEVAPGPRIEVEGDATIEFLISSRGRRLPAIPRPRSPWGTPEWVDEWTAEHGPVAA